MSTREEPGSVEPRSASAGSTEPATVSAAGDAGQRDLELLLQLAARVLASASADDVADAALDAAEAALGTARGAVLLPGADDALRFRRWRGLSDRYRAAAEDLAPWPRDDRAPEPSFIADVRLAPDLGELRPLLEAEQIGALGSFPLLAPGQVVGRLVVCYAAPRSPSPRELAMARAIANHAATGVARFAALARERRDAEALERLYDAERAARREAEALFRISGALSSAALDVEAIVQLVTDEATALTGAQYGAFFYNVADPRGQAFRLYTLSGAARAAVDGLGLPRHTPLFAPTFAGEGAIRVDDVTRDPRYGALAPHHGMPPGHLPVTSYLAVPVASRSGPVIGGLLFGHPEPGRFTAQHERMVTALAGGAAVAIDNARLLRGAREAQELEARRARERAFAGEVGATFTEGGPLAVTLQRCCDLALAHLGVTGARLWLVAEAGGELALGASAGQPPAGDPPSADAAAPPPARIAAIAQERRPRIERGAGAAIGYPLIVEERVLGVLELSADRTLSADTFEALAPVARTIAIGIERARAAAQRERLVEELERTVHYNEMFAAILGHDLRNPLGAIMAAANLLLLHTEDSKSFAWIRRILGSSERMARMVDQLLDFTRVRIGGGLVPLRHPCDLRELARQAMEEVELANPSWRFVLEASGDLTGSWHGDRIVQVLSNLIGNAVQHGAREHPLVVRLDGADPAGPVRIEIQNRGAIPPELVPELFEPFRGALNRRAGSWGLGLGLFITAQIVQAHGGEITVSSQDDSTSFRIRLPRG